MNEVRDGMSQYRSRLPTAPELEQRSAAYFAACDEAGRRYTRPGLLVALGITEPVAQRWLGQSGGRADVLRRGLLRVMDDLEQRDDAKSLFLLKQPCYGGYRDKPEDAPQARPAMDVRVCFQGEDYGR